MINEKTLENGKLIFKLVPRSYKNREILIGLIFFSIVTIISFFLILMANFFMIFPVNITYIIFSSFLMIIGILVWLITLYQAYTTYYITSENVISNPSKFFKKKQKKIALNNIAFVIDYDDGLEIAEKSEKASEKYPETRTKFRVPMIRKYKYIKLPFIEDNDNERSLRYKILKYLMERSNLVKHPNFDYVYIFKKHA